MNIHHIGLILGFPMRVGWYGVHPTISWNLARFFSHYFSVKKNTPPIPGNMEVQTWKFRRCWPYTVGLEANPGWTLKSVGTTRLKILMMRDTSVFARSPIFKNPSRSAASFAPRFTASQSRFPKNVSCHPAGDVPASWVGAGIIKWPIWRGGSDHEKYIEILREFSLKKCFVWGDPRQLSVGTEAALRRAFLLPFLAVSAASVGLAGGWRVRKSDVGGRNIYGRGSKVDLYCSITGTVFNQKGTKN